MLVKFTTKGKPTLINVNHIVGVRKDTEQKSGTYMTKIFLSTSLMVFVDEEMDEVHKVVNEAMKGNHSETYDYEIPTIDEKFESQFNNDTYNPRFDGQSPRYDNRNRGRVPRPQYNNRYNDNYRY